MLKRRIFTSCFVLLFILFSFSTVHANTVFPYKNEVVISNQERTMEQVSFRNDSTKDVNITPLVYSYNPQTLEITNTQSYIFVKTDIDVFTVEPEETISLNYEIIPVSNMDPGTYFNLIVFKTEQEDSFLSEVNSIGLTDSLSHLVVMHIADSDSSVYGITSDFAQITLEITDQGIPFIKPTKIKYTYQNTTSYVLSPEGEIQVFNDEGGYSPIYIKINEEEEKLYPGGILEEEFEVEQYSIEDLFHERTILGRFYNGIDENFKIVEITQQPNYTALGVTAAFLLLIFFVIKALISDSFKAKKSSA